MAAAPSATPEVSAEKKAAAQAHKAKGTAAFVKQDYVEAEKHYSAAIAEDPTDHILFSNRSACRASKRPADWEGALADGQECVKLAPKWAKGYGRLGLALIQTGKPQEAQRVYAQGLALDPESDVLADGVMVARKAIKKQADAEAAAAAGAAAAAVGGSKGGKNARTDAGAGSVKDEYVVGIDLGTTNSCVAVWRDGNVEILADSAGERTTPSWVAYEADGRRTVGHTAKRQAAQNPSRTLFNIKRIIGREFAECAEDVRRMPFPVAKSASGRPEITIELEGDDKKDITLAPEQVSAQVLEHMKAVAEAATGQKITKAVVTVPAYFNDAQRRLTKDAGAIAGLDVLRIINEPTAAALAYGLDKVSEGSSKILVFDLGGGTFDVSLLEITEGVFEVLATAGDTHLGGEDFDSTLVDWVSDQHRRTHRGEDDPFAGEGTAADRNRRKLRNACELAKRELSSASQATVELSAGGQEVSVKVSRAKFDALNERTFQRCLDSVKRVLTDAKVTKDDVDEVVLVGGSTRIPRVQTVLSEFFGGKTLCKSVNPDEAVAYGAAVQGAILSGSRDPATSQLLLVDVTPISLGVGCEGNKFARVVPRNTQIPCRMTSEFSTVHDNQTTIDIEVVEGESPDSRDCHLLGEFQINGIERAKAGEPKIDVTFDVDSNGLLRVSAKDRATGANANVTIEHDRGRLTPEEIERMCAQAEEQRALQAQLGGSDAEDY